jgi:hypothetical protein
VVPYSNEMCSFAFMYIQQTLFAYRMEVLVPSSPHSAHTYETPQELNGRKDVHFFSVGTLHGRTLVIYMEKKNVSGSMVV